jgi:hypothetical protein
MTVNSATEEALATNSTPPGAAVVSDGTVRLPMLSDPGTLDPDQARRAPPAMPAASPETT